MVLSTCKHIAGAFVDDLNARASKLLAIRFSVNTIHYIDVWSKLIWGIEKNLNPSIDRVTILVNGCETLRSA